MNNLKEDIHNFMLGIIVIACSCAMMQCLLMLIELL